MEENSAEAEGKPNINPPKRDPENNLKSVQPSLSSFGVLWSALEDWCSPRTIHFLHGLEVSIGNLTLESPQDVDEPTIVPLSQPSQSLQRRSALAASVAQHLPAIRADLGISAESEQEITQMINTTFGMSKPVPSLSTLQWRTICLVFLEIISWKNERIKKELQYSLTTQTYILERYGVRSDEFKVFVDIFTKPQ